MGKVQILAVLTMDGCLSSELYDKAHQDLCGSPDIYWGLIFFCILQIITFAS